jgi:hypothetical protein
MAATRYAFISRRNGRAKQEWRKMRGKINYPPWFGTPA